MNELTRQRHARDKYKGSQDEKMPERFLFTIVTGWRTLITENILMKKFLVDKVHIKTRQLQENLESNS